MLYREEENVAYSTQVEEERRKPLNLEQLRAKAAEEDAIFDAPMSEADRFAATLKGVKRIINFIKCQLEEGEAEFSNYLNESYGMMNEEELEEFMLMNRESLQKRIADRELKLAIGMLERMTW